MSAAPREGACTRVDTRFAVWHGAADDWTKRSLKATFAVTDGPALHVAASFVASLTLTTAIAPLDVTYTRYLILQHANPLACAAEMVRDGGVTALFRGWTPLWVRFLPSSVLTFLIYEQSRRVLLGQSYLD